MTSSRWILPSEPLGRVLDEIRRDVQRDRRVWSARLERTPDSMGAGELARRPDRGLVDRLRTDSGYQTFLPILLMGATGTGKKWIAELIAREWQGATLEAHMDAHASTHRAGHGKTWNPHGQVAEWLEELVQRWRRNVTDGSRDASPGIDGLPGLYTVAVVDRPASLLESELFGIAPRSATDVDAKLGAFLMAGTGVLFLDEFLEIDVGLQASLLVALESGKVQPLGGHTPEPYFCRLVAATNRAASTEELQRLSQRRELRRDFVARFPRRYVIPPLSERPLEIIPILISLLHNDRLVGRDGRMDELRLRISHPALETLVTYSHPENIRDMSALANELPDELIQSWTTELRDDRYEAWRDTSLRLEHLRRLGITASPGEPDVGVTCDLDLETDFYEFRVEAPGLGEADVDADLSEFQRAIIERGKAMHAAFEDARQRGVPAARDAATFRTLLADDGVGRALGGLCEELLQQHGIEKRDREKGALTVRVLDALLGNTGWRRLAPWAPLAAIASEVARDLRGFEEALHDAIGRSVNREATGAPGRPMGLHGGVVLSVLSGRPIRLHK